MKDNFILFAEQAERNALRGTVLAEKLKNFCEKRNNDEGIRIGRELEEGLSYLITKSVVKINYCCDREDLVFAGYEGLHNGIMNFEGAPKELCLLRYFLRKCIFRKIIDYIRKYEFSKKRMSEENLGEIVSEETPLDILIKGEEQIKLFKGMEKLSKEDNAVLRYYFDSEDEQAKLRHKEKNFVSKETLRWRRWKAVQNLRDAIFNDKYLNI